MTEWIYLYTCNGYLETANDTMIVDSASVTRTATTQCSAATIATCTLLTAVVGAVAHGHKLDQEGIVALAREALVVAPASLRRLEARRETKLYQSLLMRSQRTLDA